MTLTIFLVHADENELELVRYRSTRVCLGLRSSRPRPRATRSPSSQPNPASGSRTTKSKTRSTKVTSACFEPMAIHVVVKTPRWDPKTFSRVSLQLSSSMTGVGGMMLCEGALGLDA
jgi:hypothetical protein